ncbi:MAG: hypothetical protein J6A77_12565 [Lachnospiraceae bacterium]|nr:hypothetical protein [Lachnospiraceae bacterium]
MFHSGYSIHDAREKLWLAEDKNAFSSAMNVVKNSLKELNLGPDSMLELEKRAYYVSNDYSEKDTKEKVLEAKQRVIAYLDELMENTAGHELLQKILENFYFFLEALLEREPHGRGGIQKPHLENIQIKNEYDVQHFLYAYLKPLYPEVRAEVSEDTGYSTVRVDISLDTECVIEVKCTRKGMTLKKLIEEIEADMVHYSARTIYFFIYDKEKLIENPLVFKQTYQKKMKEKKIHIVIHQPKNM